MLLTRSTVDFYWKKRSTAVKIFRIRILIGFSDYRIKKMIFVKYLTMNFHETKNKQIF